MQPVSVLFIEDSEDDVDLVLLSLQRDGLQPRWHRVQSESAMREALGRSRPDAILSDFSMPGFDGLTALRVARQLAPEVPFIFVSGTIGEERAIEAIRLGATDYVLKNNLRRLGTALTRALSEAGDRKRARDAEEERARLVEILEATSDVVGMTDPEGRSIYLNAAGRRMHGPLAQELVSRECRTAAMRDGVWSGEAAVRRADGTEVPMSQVIIAHRTADASAVRFFSSIARDISERKAYEARLKYLANYDSLTGLPNRSLLGDRAWQAIAHARRTDRGCAMVGLNVDRFKLLNDSYGHGAGDALLKLIAERLSAAMREGDTAARLGADTFAVLASDLARPDDVLNLARKLREITSAPFLVEGHEIHVTLSVGASTYPRDGEDFDLLLRNAEAAMNRVKAEGGNAFQFYAAAMTREALEHVELENALRNAIARKELELHYQPQVELRGHRIVGLEALMRWKHPQRGYIPPALFIPIAEQSDLIQQLGAWALMEATRQLAEWQRAGGHTRVAVNVSARQFADEGFVDTVARALRLHGIEPAFLELELTESALIDDRDRALGTLAALKRLGVQIAVDDFGTGYSSLSHLSTLPVDCLKIDRAFVMKVAAGGRDAAVAQAIVSLGHALGMRVLAEGIETAEQLAFLRAHHCDEGQGYLFARPRGANTVLPLLAAGALAPAPDGGPKCPKS
jgi:diguanylate cyclase (GGDEF)-like protein